MNEYKVAYSYYSNDRCKRIYEEDTTTAFTAREAVEDIERWYSDLTELRIEDVWVDRDNRWYLTDAWDF